LASETRRLFFALWPDEGVRARLEALRDGFSLGRPIAGRNLHLTLAFLGELDEAAQRCVLEAAARLTPQPFTLCLDEMGWFRRPQVLWVGASQTPAPLAGLVARLNEGLQACGFPPETRPYSAHVTLARKVHRGPPKAQAIPPVEWRVEEFVLVESILGQRGAEYQPLRRWPMA
jgi:2'-5' RNA ligase